MQANNIRQIRIKKGISSQQAIKVLNISYSMFNKIERGDRFPGKDTIIQMSKLYKCSIDEIYNALNFKVREA